MGENMKKILLVLLVIGIITFNMKEEEKQEKEEIRGVFISYIELSKQIKGKEEKIAKANIKTMIQNIKKLKLNTIILQIRPTSDAIYPSKIFPYSIYVSSKEGDKTFDILKYYLEESHNNNMKLIAWINPYRIRTTEDISTISNLSPAYPYLETDTVYYKNGIYWNPSKKEVTDLILKGVEEVLTYEVDGILFDDYFYPDSEIDHKDYEVYKEKHPSISEEEYHLQVINEMVKKVHQICQKKNVRFGISPDGNIDNNYQRHYADVKTWMKDNTYIDFIMPQIYYGFYNSTRAYLKVAREWDSLLKTNLVDLYIALAFYKVGKEDLYAQEGKNEWIENNNIIMKEIILSRNLDNYKGFSLFRYDSIFNNTNVNQNSKIELENLKRIIK